MTRYVAGFLFDDDGKRVTLITKLRPKWQAYSFNGVGGKVEENERATEAMEREFREETGVYISRNDWDNFLTLWGDWGVVHFFRFFSTEHQERVKTVTDEPVENWVVNDVLASNKLIRNLVWVLPLARYRGDTYETVMVKDRVW